MIAPTPEMSARRLLSASSVSLIAQAVGLLAIFILTPIQLRAMGQERYGLVALAAATASYVTVFDIGGGWSVMRYVPLLRSKGDLAAADEAFSTALTASLSVGTLGAITIWVVAPRLASAFHPTPRETVNAVNTIRISGLWMPPILCGGVLNGAARAMGRFRVASVVAAGSVVSFNVLWALIATNGGSPQDVALAQLSISTAALLLWIVILTLGPPSPRLRIPRDASLARGVLAFSALSSVAQLGGLLLGTVGTVVIASGVGATAIVYYTIPLSLAQRMTLVSSTVTSIAFPRLSQDRSGDPQRNALLLRNSHSLVTIATGGVAVILLWSGRSLLALWISPTFARHASTPLRLLVIGFTAVSLSSIYQVHLEAVGHNAAVMVSNLTAGVIGIALCFLLSRTYAERGGALGISIGLMLLATTVVIISIIFERSPATKDVFWTGKTLLTLAGSVFAAQELIRLCFGRPAPGAIILAASVIIASVVMTLMTARAIRQPPAHLKA